MSRITHSRCVLAVRNLDVSTRYWVDVLDEQPAGGPGNLERP